LFKKSIYTLITRNTFKTQEYRKVKGERMKTGQAQWHAPAAPVTYEADS
jgi:hypothetical protein